MKFSVIRILSAVLLAVAASSALAAEWAIEPSVDTRASLTDNVNLTPGVHENVFNWTLAPRVVFSRRTEATEVAGTAGLGINRYPGNPELDTDDANFSLTSQLHEERATYGLLASYVRDSTLESELATTGIVLTRQQRDLASLAPSWNYSLTVRSSVFAQYQYDLATYQAGSGLIDYTNQQASGGYQYLVSERTAATLSGNYSRYKAEDGSTLTDTYGFSIGLTHAWSESLNLTLGFGSRHSDITSVARVCVADPSICAFFGIPVSMTFHTSSNGLSYNISADYRWERSSANFALSSDINPSGNGTVVQTDRASIGFNHQFSERLSGTAFAAYLVSRNISGLGGETEYSIVSANLSRRLDEWWTLATGYSFAYQKEENTPQGAVANTVFLSISYNWPRISMSR